MHLETDGKYADLERENEADEELERQNRGDGLTGHLHLSLSCGFNCSPPNGPLYSDIS